MVLKFENRTNSTLYMEKSTNLSVILGTYNNSNEIYDSQLSILDYSYKITPVDGKKFMVSSPVGKISLGKVIKGLQLIVEDGSGRAELKDDTTNCRILRFDSNTRLVNAGDKIFSEAKKSMCRDYEINDYIFTVADENAPENRELLELCNHYPLQDNEVMVTADIIGNVIGERLHYTNKIDFPTWIYQGVPLVFTKITDKLDFENTDEFGDSSPILLEYTEECIGIIDGVNYNPLESYFTVDIDTKITTKNNKGFRISCNSKQNHGNIIEQNTLGGSVNIGLTAVNNGEFIRCTDFNCSNGGLLLYDQLYEKKVGTVTGQIGSKILKGFNTNFLIDFKPDDLMLVEGHETPLKIKKVMSNVNIELYEPLEFAVDELDIYLTDSIHDNMESIIYDVYDNRDNNSQGNFHNIMPIRGNRKIKFFFGANEKNIRNVTGNIFETELNPDLYNIYKLWVNGRLLEYGKDYIFKSDKTIQVLDETIIRKYNNYCYFIYYPKQYDNTNNYAFLAYEGYKTNFPSKLEYVESLYKFPYYSNFSESPSYNYYEFRDEVLDTSKRILLDKMHTISFSSYITNDAGEVNNKNVTIDLENITRNTYGFRLIRHNKDTNTFTVYNECQLVNPAAETINDDANIVTYTINHKDKIILLDRSFGDGDWGRFELFGLKLLGIY